MSAPSGRKRKGVGKIEEQMVVKFPDVNIFIVDRNIQRVRFEHLKKLARRKGFRVADTIKFTGSQPVTHIVAELDHREEVLAAIQSKAQNDKDLADKVFDKAEVVSIDWFTACMEESQPVEVTDLHRVKEKPKVVDAPKVLPTVCGYKDAKYACQRRTPLNHHNKLYTDALETLEKHAEFLDDNQNKLRALAFRKASAALKALPKPIRSMRDVENLYDLRGGKHCKKVIEELIDDGFSTEIDNITGDVWYKTMQIFTGVFGCGAATARKWYDKDMRTLEDVIGAHDISLTKQQRKGIEFYHDLNTPVNRTEAEVIQDLVVTEVEQILPGATVVITGGFIRGKESGHDVDLLISHPEEGKEEGLLEKLLRNLDKRDLLEYTDIQNSSFSKETLKRPAQARRGFLDHFERCFSILRLPKHLIEENKRISSAKHNQDNMQNSGTIDIPEASAAKQKKLDNSIVNNGGDTNIQSTGVKQNAAKSIPETFVCDPDTIVENRGDANSDSRSWVAKRVDLIIAPASQYPYAIMGWTGSRMFNRSVRDYANKEMNMTLSSHGLFDRTNNKQLPATTEKDIFEHLKLEYREPWERNC